MRTRITRMTMVKKPAKPARKSTAKPKSRKPAAKRRAGTKARAPAVRKAGRSSATKRTRPSTKRVARPAAKRPATKPKATKPVARKKIETKKPAGKPHAKAKTTPKSGAKAPKVDAKLLHKGKVAAKTPPKIVPKSAGKPVKPIAGKPASPAAPATAKGAKGAGGKAVAPVAPGHKPTAAEIAAKIAGKRAEDAVNKKGRNGRHAEIAPRVLTPADVEARKRRLKTLIVLGKERGFLTFAEINDHLPDDVLDAEQDRKSVV